jgi:AraC-like DNA-binding protein
MLPASAVWPLLDYADRLGHRPSPRMGRIAARLREPMLVVPYAAGIAVVEELLAAGAGEDVGLRAGAAARVERLGPFGDRLARAPTVAAGIDLLLRQRHNTAQRFSLSRRGPEVWLERHMSASVREGRAQERELALMMLLQYLRLGAGRAWRPAEIHFEGPPPRHAEELAALAERGVSFGARRTAVVFPARLLERPIPRPALPAAESGLSPIPIPPTEFVASLRVAVRSLLQVGELSLAVAAEAAGTSTRSLQRRLARAGLSFAEVVDDVRFALACELLRDERAKVVEVAAELGYNDSANFTRAFRRWAGVPPRSFRRALAEPALAS